MKKIQFLGAAGGEVTGSCYLLTADDESQVMVDYGMFQGTAEIVTRNYDIPSFNPADLQSVFLTHAHLDHSGRLPLLYYGGFRGKIYMTAPTKSFVEILLKDSARIAEKYGIREPLYTLDAVHKILRHIQIVKYDREVKTRSFTALFRDAGHILGSSSIELTDTTNEKNERIVFSGDLGNTPQRIVKPTQYIEHADFVVMESTYGDSSHPEEDPVTIIQEEINTVEESSGVLLIPAFAIERTQELLHIIHHLKEEGRIKAETPVFLDSPMGIDTTLIYLNFKQLYNAEMSSHTNIPFNFEGVVVTNDSRDSRNIIREKGPKVIIAGSGMMSGGRIMHHAYNYLSEDTTRILFVGYQAEETMGRDILRGAKAVTIDGAHIKVRATIREIKSLSSHADQPKLITWLTHIQGVKKVFLTHGEKEVQIAFATKITKELTIKNVHIPEYEEEFTL